MAAKIQNICLLLQDTLSYIMEIQKEITHYSQDNSLEISLCNKSMLFTILLSKMFEL